MTMGFDTEPTGYEKTILSDLQSAWQSLRGEVADNSGFVGWERALFHIDEAMSTVSSTPGLPRSSPAQTTGKCQ